MATYIENLKKKYNQVKTMQDLAKSAKLTGAAERLGKQLVEIRASIGRYEQRQKEFQQRTATKEEKCGTLIYA